MSLLSSSETSERLYLILVLLWIVPRRHFDPFSGIKSGIKARFWLSNCSQRHRYELDISVTVLVVVVSTRNMRDMPCKGRCVPFTARRRCTGCSSCARWGNSWNPWKALPALLIFQVQSNYSLLWAHKPCCQVTHQYGNWGHQPKWPRHVQVDQ